MKYFVKSLKASSIVFIVGGLMIGFYQRSFLKQAGIEELPPEFYGEIIGTALAYSVIALPVIYIYFRYIGKK